MARVLAQPTLLQGQHRCAGARWEVEEGHSIPCALRHGVECWVTAERLQVNEQLVGLGNAEQRLPEFANNSHAIGRGDRLPHGAGDVVQHLIPALHCHLG